MIAFILVFTLGFLALGSGALIVGAKVQFWKDQVNPRLAPLNLYWDSFRLFDIPPANREEFFLKRGQQAGIERGISMDGIGALLVGGMLLVQWAFYPRAKKRALETLAESQNLSPEEIRRMAEQLR